MKKLFNIISLVLLAGGIMFSSCTDKYTITVLSNNDEWGTVEGGGSYVAGTNVTLTAKPNEGYAFLKWDDGVSDNPRSFNVTAHATYTAIFVELPSDLGVNVTFNDNSWEAGDVHSYYNYGDNSWRLIAHPDENMNYPGLNLLMFKNTTGVVASSVNTQGVLTNKNFGWIEYYLNETYYEDGDSTPHGDYWAKLVTVNVYEFGANSLIFTAVMTATMFSAIEAFKGVDGHDPVGVDGASTASMKATMTRVQMERYTN